MAVARDTVPFRTEWQVEPAHGVVISDDDRLCATQTGGGAYVWSAVPLPTAGCVYWELEFELPKPGIPAPTWITREDLQRYVEDNAGRLKTAKAPLAACCSSKPQKPPAESTRQLLRRLGSGWTMKALLKRLDELAKTNPADIEWPGPPEPTTLRRGDSLGGAYFAGVVEDPVSGETVLRSRKGAWGLSDDKNNGGSHLRENGRPAGALLEEHLNASSCAFGHLERVGIMADMDSRPRVLQFYRDGVLIPTATVLGFPETVYIAATPKTKGVKVRLGFPTPPTRSDANTDSTASGAAVTRRRGKTLWKVATTGVRPQIAADAAAKRNPSVWRIAQDSVRKRRLDLKKNETPCIIEYAEPGPLGIAFGYENGVTWVEAVSRNGTTANLVNRLERDIEGCVVSEVCGERPRDFDEIAGKIQSGERPITLVFTYPTKDEEKVMRGVEKNWIKEDRRDEKVKLQEAKAAAKIARQEMKDKAAVYKHEVKQASRTNKGTGKLVRGADERHLSKAKVKSGWKTVKRKMPDEFKKKKKASLFELAAQEQGSMQAVVAKSVLHRPFSPAMQASSLRENDAKHSDGTVEQVDHNAGVVSTRAKARRALLQGLRNGKLALAMETVKAPDAATAAVQESREQRASHETKLAGGRSDRSPMHIQNGKLSATRAKTRGALLQGLRNGKLAAAVETMEAAQPTSGAATSAQEPSDRGIVDNGSTIAATSAATPVVTETKLEEMRQQVEATKLESAELRRSVMWLREILTAKEKAGGTRTDEHALLQDHLFRATDELCETRIEAAEMSSRNDELERQMLEITTSFKARLAEAEGERERAAVVAKKERRVLTKQLRLAKEEKATLARRAVATGGLAEHLNAATLPLPASSASTSLPDPTTRQGDF